MNKRLFICLTALCLLLAQMTLATRAWATEGDDFSQFADKRIGIQTGTNFDALVRKTLPDATISYYNTRTDLVNALKANKIDAFAEDEPVLKVQMQQDSSITAAPGYLEEFDLGFIFPKTDAGQVLCDQFDEFLEGMKAEGKLKELEEKWCEGAPGEEMPDYEALPATNGRITLATEALYEPFTFIRDGNIVGFDIEIVARFCQEYGYGMDIIDMSYDAVLPSVVSGKCDLGASGITITPERAESVLFSVPYFSGSTVLVVLNEQEAEKDAGYWAGISESIHKTFLRESRWQLFAEGIGTTLVITVLSLLFGTALGFGVFMLCRNGNLLANAVTSFSIWLVQGMPVVVFLMILYYVVFGKVAIHGIVVAVVGFTFTFGCSVFGLLKMGVGAVDIGQYEAAYALGYSGRRTFFRIILPQALPHIMSAYQSEIVGLMKATSVVGYIAVQDLTKMGVIVRSRTYEAFFPLIAVTIIYFVLEGLLGTLVGKVGLRINPKQRRPEDILKGIRTEE